jgi:Abnormal spindle-like microcephaly-assoc'd, ASPM-SPD-2-Hydin
MSYRTVMAATLVALSSSLALAQLEVSPTSLTFATQPVGTTSAKQQVNVSNGGSTAVTFTSIATTGNFSISSMTCSLKAALAAGASCYVRIGFTPATAGNKTGTLTLVDSDPNSPHQVSLTGVGAADDLSPASINFGTQLLNTTSNATPVVLTNSATTALTVTAVAITETGCTSSTGCDFQIASQNCIPAGSSTGTVNGDATCTIKIVFAPTTVIGRHTGTLTVTAGSGSQTVALSGTASAVSLSTSSLAFGSQNLNVPSAVQTVSITNLSSTASFNVTGISTSLPVYSQVSSCIPVGATSGKLLPNATCGIYVTFEPTATGSQTGTMSITTGGGGGTQSVTLSGNGVSPAGIALRPQVAAITNTTIQSLTVTPTSSNVTWLVDQVANGNSSVGTITPTGANTANYKPPTVDGLHTITATTVGSPSASASMTIIVTDYPGVLTYHNDNTRDAQNQQETALNPSNVNVAQFGKLFSYSVDAQVYAQPLYVASAITDSNGVTHNVLYVATENDTVYAFDADGLTATPLWKNNFGSFVPSTTVSSFYDDLSPQIGITGTPVIDASAGTLFVVTETNDDGTVNQRLHALNMTTGKEQAGSPVLITASITTTDPTTGKPKTKTFNPVLQNQRPALLLLNGVVYIAWGSFGDIGTYHGWLMGYNETTLAQESVYITTPVDSYGGIWQSGGGPAADSSGYIYVTSGNGPDDVATGGSDFSGALVKLSTTAGLDVVGYFKPADKTTQNSLEMSSGGPILVNQTGSDLVVVAGKDENAYLVNRDAMNLTNPTGSLLPSVSGAFKGGMFSTPSYWQNNVYFWAEEDILRSFEVKSGQLTATETYPLLMSYPGAQTTVSSNGSKNGILWALDAKGVLHAFDATNVSHEFYNSSEAGTRDAVPGQPVKFAVPTVANGKVYVGSDPWVSGYGLLPCTPFPACQ